MMKRLIMILLSIMVLSAASHALDFSIGAMGGITIPIVQEDQGNGSMFGLKGKVSIIPGVSVEPNLYFSKLGNAEFDFGTIPGSKITSYGVNAIVGGGQGGPGFSMYGLAGLGFYSMSRDVDTYEDVTKFGFCAGAGMEIGVMPSLGIDVRGKLDIISSEGGGSKKSAAILGGLNYYFGM